jgi:hypothetical protein
MITGQQARELLDGTTPGPWEWDKQTGDIESPPYILAETFIDADANGPLIVSAPDLAETVAWLYGRKSDDESVWDDHYEVSATADKRVAVFDHDATTTFFTPDEAIEFARALLAAAEQARHE